MSDLNCKAKQLMVLHNILWQHQITVRLADWLQYFLDDMGLTYEN